MCLVWRGVMQRAGKRLLPPAGEKSRFSHFPGHSGAQASPPRARPRCRQRLEVTDGPGCHQCGTAASPHPAPGRAVFLRPAPAEGQAGTAATQILPANDIFLQSRRGANRSPHRVQPMDAGLFPAPASGWRAWSSCASGFPAARSLSRGARHPRAPFSREYTAAADCGVIRAINLCLPSALPRPPTQQSCSPEPEGWW